MITKTFQKVILGSFLTIGTLLALCWWQLFIFCYRYCGWNEWGDWLWHHDISCHLQSHASEDQGSLRWKLQGHSPKNWEVRKRLYLWRRSNHSYQNSQQYWFEVQLRRSQCSRKELYQGWIWQNLRIIKLDYSNHSLPNLCWVIFHMAQQDPQGQNVTKLANFLVDHLCCSGAYRDSFENLCLPCSYIDDLWKCWSLCNAR